MGDRVAPSRRPLARVALFVALLVPARAGAQEPPVKPTESGPPSPPQAPAPPPPVPDAVFAALRDHQVVLMMRSSPSMTALVLADQGDMLVVATVPKGQVVFVPKRDVADLRVVLAPQVEYLLPELRRGPRRDAEEPPTPPAPIPQSNRHVGIHLGVAPSAMIDVEHGHFLAFASTSILLPFLTRASEESGTPFGGFGNDSHLWGFLLGAGATFRLADTTRWRFDIFGIGGASNWDPNNTFVQTYAAFGMGIGFHVTLDDGFTFGVKAPIVGGATTGSDSGSAASLGTFFSLASVAMPLVSFGYRF